MRLRFCFIIFNYLLAALGVACLIFAEVVPAFAGVVLMAVVGLTLILELQKKIPILPPKAFSPWKVGILVFPVVYLVFQPEVLDLMVWFLLALLITRFIYKSEFNDYLYGYLISIVCLLMGALFIQDMVFGAVFFSFYLSLCWSFMFYNMMVERVGSHCPPDQFRSAGEQETAGVSLFALSSSIVIISLALTATIFVTFPRMGLGFLSLEVSAPPVSGFSNRVTLGEVGKIKQNDSVVMRVEFKRNGQTYRPQNRVLWRGVALDYYDGKTWSTTMPRAWRRRNWSGRGIRLFNPTSSKRVVQQNIFMETFNSPVIFTFGVPLFIEGSFQTIQMDESYSLKTTDTYTGPKRFTLFSDIKSPDNNYSQPLPLPRQNLFPVRFLQMPPVSENLGELASSLRRPEESPEKTAHHILNFLLENYDYSMNMKRSATQISAMDEFLFVNKKGHCEYFASAMVLLLRLNDIPARIVNGFMGEEWNDLGQYMIVRQAHAHSWVEAYIPGKGWQSFDPTPPAPIGAESRETTFSRSMDWVRLNWQRYVIKYSLRDQVHLAQIFNRETREIAEQLKTLKSFKKEDFLQFIRNYPRLLGGMVLILLLTVLWKLKSVVWRMIFQSAPPAAVQVYQQMLHRLEKHGILKSHSWTHKEFLENLGDLPEEKRIIVQEITQFYELHRFGQQAVSTQQKRHLEHLIRQI